MNVLTELKSSKPGLDDDWDIVHYFCCNEDLSLCGKDISEAELGQDENDMICIVCKDLDEAGHCDNCGN